ncbi:UspA domain-containing protein [Natronorubrum tibetense GA33]|uniref:UspA domain-containing protein n=1 Tax=Natronorubrum tibetense GA33 TaxID=1114856 RepID=L9W875_9EURY|nr:UspA domain-containing protein [Natronorubrum tibetense GA33]
MPTDGSDGALVGAKRGIDLATTADAIVHVLSVVDTSEADAVSSVLEREDTEQRATVEAEAETAVDAVASLARDRDAELEVTTATERGTAFRVIDRYVDENGIDAVAMGTKGLTGLRRVVLGSVAENVLRTVGVPILVAPPDAEDTALTEETVENVLVPTDGSRGAAAAVDWGITLADAFDAMVHALYSVDTSRYPDRMEPDEVLTTLDQPGRGALEMVRERATEYGVSVTGTVATGPPARIILDYADDEIDFVVIGTHGRSGLERHLLGSVTENVVRNADVPVFCVPMDGD